MCGRFGLTEPLQLQRGAGLSTVLHAYVVGDALERLLVPRYSIAPSQLVIAIRTRSSHISGLRAIPTNVVSTCCAGDSSRDRRPVRPWVADWRMRVPRRSP